MAINNKITYRRGSSSEWSSVNPILANGEPGWDITNGILKIGDGITHWNDLSPLNYKTVKGSFSVSSSTSTFNISEGYQTGYLDVFLNGVKLSPSGDYTATNGGSFTLAESAPSGSIVEYVGIKPGTSSDPERKAVLFANGPFDVILNDFDHQNADRVFFDLSNSPSILWYLSLTGMKAGYHGQMVTLCNLTPTATNTNTPRIQIYSQQNTSLENNRLVITNAEILVLLPGQFVTAVYNDNTKKWYLHNIVSSTISLSSGSSVGGGGV